MTENIEETIQTGTGKRQIRRDIIDMDKLMKTTKRFAIRLFSFPISEQGTFKLLSLTL